MSEQPTDHEGPAAGISDKAFRIWQRIFGWAAAAAVFAAAIVSVNDPTLTYEDLEPSNGTMTVACRSTGDGFARQNRSGPSAQAFGYEITDGQAAYDAWSEAEAERLSGVVPTFSVSDEIADACASSDLSRLQTAVWILALAIALGFCCIWVSLTRARREFTRHATTRPPSDVVTATNPSGASDSEGEPARTDRDQ